MAPPKPPSSPEELRSALPSTRARVLAFAAIVAAGTCGGLLGYAVTDLQCQGDCGAVATGLGALAGAAMAAAGVAVVAVLVLRAMGEWRVIQLRQEGGQPHPTPPPDR